MKNVRPTFLTVLCVLTFIASAYGIYSGATTYFNADVTTGVTKDKMDEARDQMEAASNGDEKSAEMANKIIDSISSSLSVEKIKQSAISSILSNLLTLIGAILMWGLSKKGFWIYVVGAFLAVITPFFIFGGWMAAISAGGAGFIAILFCILYYVNYKHLT